MSELSRGQTHTLIVALRASVVPDVVAAMMQRDFNALAAWLNANSTTQAWMDGVTKREMFEAMNISTYDSVSAGKKESWQLMLSMTPIDMTRGGMRKGVLDIFATADANAMLAAFTEKASRAEEIIGGSSPTTGTVTALKRDWIGDVLATDLRAGMK